MGEWRLLQGHIIVAPLLFLYQYEMMYVEDYLNIWPRWLSGRHCKQSASVINIMWVWLLRLIYRPVASLPTRRFSTDPFFSSATYSHLLPHIPSSPATSSPTSSPLSTSSPASLPLSTSSPTSLSHSTSFPASLPLSTSYPASLPLSISSFPSLRLSTSLSTSASFSSSISSTYSFLITSISSPCLPISLSPACCQLMALYVYLIFRLQPAWMCMSCCHGYSSLIHYWSHVYIL